MKWLDLSRVIPADLLRHHARSPKGHSESGKKKLIAIYERRKSDQWKHPVIGYSLSYSRLIELEVRLLEKEWMGEGGLFARFRLR